MPVSGITERKTVLSGRNSVLAGLFFMAVYLWPNPNGVGVPVCGFYALTHLPCPACGTTRSVLAIVHGQWAAGWRLNPLGFLVCWLALMFLGGPLIRRWLPGLEVRISSPVWQNNATLVLLALLAVFGVLRLFAVRFPGLAELLHISTTL